MRSDFCHRTRLVAEGLVFAIALLPNVAPHAAGQQDADALVQQLRCTLPANYGHSGIGLRDFLKPERLTIEANPFLQARDVDADGY
jgi:hypothetical protein